MPPKVFPLALTLSALAGCHSPPASPPPPQRADLHEVHDASGHVTERDVTSENEPPPPPVNEVAPPRPYATALYIRGYWYQDRPRHRWVWIHGYWR